MIEIEIDGKKVDVPPGSMVMDAANKVGTYIPHFCYHKKLSIAANCRMCLVEVEKAPKPLPACATPVTAGMVVRTSSEKAVKAQKSVLEFLLINHPLDCPICDQGGECQLQDLTVGYGPTHSRYQEEKRVVFHKNVGPLISMEGMSRCIHCTRCVRFGQEIAGVMELGMIGRGEHAEITTFVGKTVDSELSGNMIDLCPVGALLSKPFLFKARNWELSRRKSVSPHDGLGANLIVQVKNHRVMRVLPLENEGVNECWISDKDRFSYDALNSEDRLTKPMIRQGGQWREVDWPTALDYVAHGLKNIAREHGAETIGALASPHSTLEELGLLQKLMRGIGSENIDFRLRHADFSLDRKIVPWLGMSIGEFGQLSGAFVIGSFLRKDHPLLAARLRQAAKSGAKISILHATDDALLMPLATKIVKAPNQWLNVLGEVVVAVAKLKNSVVPEGLESVVPSEFTQRIASQLCAGEGQAILLGNAAAHHPDAAQLHAAAQWLAQHTGAKFGYLTEAANTVGGYLAGALPGARGAHAMQMLEQPRKAYVLLNTEPELDCANPHLARTAMDKAEMVVVLSPFKQGMHYADVLLPIAPFTETSGTFVNCEGRAQSFHGVVKPLGDSRPGWKVLRVLGNTLQLNGFDYDSSEAVRNEIMDSNAGGDDLIVRCATRLNNQDPALPHWRKFAHPSETSRLQRVADVPIYFADALARRSVPLQETADAQPPKAYMSAASIARLGLTEGMPVRLTQGAGSAVLNLALDKDLPDSVVRVAAAHSSTAGLGAMFGDISVERA